MDMQLFSFNAARQVAESPLTSSPRIPLSTAIAGNMRSSVWKSRRIPHPESCSMRPVPHRHGFVPDNWRAARAIRRIHSATSKPMPSCHGNHPHPCRQPNEFPPATSGAVQTRLAFSNARCSTLKMRLAMRVPLPDIQQVLHPATAEGMADIDVISREQTRASDRSTSSDFDKRTRN